MKALDFLKRKFPLWDVQDRLEFNTVMIREENLIEAMEEYASQLAGSPGGTYEALKNILPLAEDGYKLHISNACHEEFLKEDRECLELARKVLRESSSGDQAGEAAELKKEVERLKVQLEQANKHIRLLMEENKL